MRGKEGEPGNDGKSPGITPAYAGKSRRQKPGRGRIQDHPRVCGEKCCESCPEVSIWGSPPRVRGKVFPGQLGLLSGWITPACAGKSGHAINPNVCGQDHPRVCGEKSPFSLFRPPHLGSPPRMRGKGISCCCRKRPGGITPACAGKSSLACCPWRLHRDHPRVCGEKFTEKEGEFAL